MAADSPLVAMTMPATACWNKHRQLSTVGAKPTCHTPTGLQTIIDNLPWAALAPDGAALAHGCCLSPLRGSAAVGYARMGIADIALTTMPSLSITLQLPTFMGNRAFS